MTLEDKGRDTAYPISGQITRNPRIAREVVEKTRRDIYALA